MHKSTSQAHETSKTGALGLTESQAPDAQYKPSSPGTHRLLLQHVSLQQAAREEGPSRVRSPRASEVYLAAKTELAGKGSPIKNKLQASSSSSRGNSPARWGKAAGSLSPIPVLQPSSSSTSSPTPTAPSSARDHVYSSSAHRHTDENGLQQVLMAQPAQLHPHPWQGAAVASAFGTAATSPRTLAQINGTRASSATLQPSQPLASREGGGTDSPNRLRLRTISAPGSSQLHTQLHTIALQQATLQSQQSQLAGVGEMQSPRVARNNSRIPANYAQLNLVVTGSVDGSHCGLASPPGSDGSVVSVYSTPGESPGGSHSQAQPSRFRPKPPMAAPSSTSNSASSTPSGGTAGSAVSAVSSVNCTSSVGWQPHPPSSCRKGSKPLSAGAVVGSVSECSSPHMLLHGSLPPIGDARGGDSPAPNEPTSAGSSSAFQRRGRSLVHIQAADPGMGGSTGSSGSVRGGQGMLRVRGLSAGADGSTPNSPSGCARTPSSNGGLCSNLSRHDSGEYGYFGDLLAGGSSSGGGGGVSSPCNGRSSAGAAVMLGSSAWQHGAFHSNSGGGAMLSARDSTMSAASPLGFSSSSSGGGGAAPHSAVPTGAINYHWPGSSRGGHDMVKKLVAAVRSRNDVQLEAVLAEYGNSGAHDLSDRCPTTDRTALHEAVCLGSESMVKLLLAAGSDPNVGHPKEGPPLLQAAAVGALDIVHLLLKHGADMQRIDAQRLTALHHACRSGHVDVAHLLIRRGADLKACTVDGETPLDLASKDARIALCSAAAAATVQEAPSALQRQLSGPLQHTAGAGSSSSFPATPSSTKEAAHVSVFANSSSSNGASDDAAAAGAAVHGGFTGFPGDQNGLHLSSAVTAERTMSSPSILRRNSSAGGSSGMRCTSTGGGGLLSQVSSATPSAAATPAAAPPVSSSGSSPLPIPPLSSSSASHQYSSHQPLHSSSSSIAVPGSSGGAAAGAGSLSSPNGLIESCVSVANMRKPSPPAISMRESSSGGGRPRSGLMSGPPSAEPSASGESSAKTPKDTPQDDYNRCRTPPPLLNLPKDYQGRKGRFAQQQRQSSSGGGASKQASSGLEDTQRGLHEDDQAAMHAVSYQHAVGSQAGHLAAAQAAAQAAAAAMRALTVQESGWQMVGGSPTAAAAAAAAAAVPGRWPGLLPVVAQGGAAGGVAGGTEASFGSVIGSGSSAGSFSSSSGGAAVRGLSRVSAPPAVGGSSSSRSSREAEACSGQQPAFRLPFDIGSSSAGPLVIQQQQQQQPRKPPHQPLQVPALQQVHQQLQLQEELHQQQSAPAALPVFKFGIDPSSTMDRLEAKAAAAAAAAAVAARHQQGGVPGAESYNPLEHSFKLRMADHTPKHLAVTMQQHDQQQKTSRQQQQQQFSGRLPAHTGQNSGGNGAAAAQQHYQRQQQQQQQPWPPRMSFDKSDTRVPPLLHDQSPAASPRAGASSSSNATPEVAVIVGYTAAHGSSRSTQQHLSAGLTEAVDAVTTSSEALGLSAARMFEHCVDHTVGDIQWKCGGLLGEGAYGKVYQGLDLCTGNMMAVKELQLVGRRGSEEVKTQLKELAQELEFYKKLDHPNIVGYIDASFKTATNTLYIFLEYVPGGSIADMIKQFGPFPEEMAAKYTRQLLVGLQYLHDQQIVHRDLKGGNVLVTPTGVVKVADFGASKPFGDPAKTDMMKSLRGSAFWMAPEILRGSGYGRKADIWSLGCTVLEMLSGKHPWPDYDNQWAVMLAITQTETGPPRPSGISPVLSDFLDKCFKMDPKQRSSASELLQHPWVIPQPHSGARTRASLSDDV